MSKIKDYLDFIHHYLTDILTTEEENIQKASKILSEQIKQDKLIHVIGPGGHSNLGTQEIFFRAGGLMHINPILDEGTLLSNGALRSMAMERLPGYGKIVFQHQNIQAGDVLILINAYGINAAVIDVALMCKENNVTCIAVTSRQHAQSTAEDHPARHPTKKNLCDIADIVLDCKIQTGDAVITLEGMEQKIAAMSSFANNFVLNCLVIKTVEDLLAQGIAPPVWRSGNASGGDEWNAQFLDRFKHRISCL